MSDVGRRWRLFEGQMLAKYAELVSRTARWSVEGMSHFEAVQDSDRPVLWATWHGMLYPAFMWGVRAVDRSKFLAIIVGDKRSDVLEGMINGIGAQTAAVDMGGNPVAAGRSVLRVVRHLREGKQTYIMPDGPDGPAFEAKPGVFFLARKARAIVVPAGACARPAFEIPRWDRYLVPLPFSRIFMVFGEPISIDNRRDAAELEQTLPEVLNQLRSRARVLAGRRP